MAAPKAKGRSRATAVAHEPAFILHRYDWSESSLILDAFTRHHGRVALVAKGVKRPTSGFRPVLLPMQPLWIGYSGDAEVKTLKSAEWAGGHAMPVGDALMAGYHANELLMLLLPREDAHPGLFDRYADTVKLLAQRGEVQLSAQPELLNAALRLFELHLLNALGVLPDLSCETQTQQPLQADVRYLLVPDLGLRRAAADEGGVLGKTWSYPHQILNSKLTFLEQIQLLTPVSSGLRVALRGAIQHHTGRQRLRTRQVMVQMQGL